MRSAWTRIVVLAALGAAAGGCSMTGFVADNMVGLLEDVEREFRSDGSYQHGRLAGPGLLKTLDGVIAASPDNEVLLAMGCRMNAGYALAFVETLTEMTDEEKAWSRSLNQRALGYGLRALDDPEFEAAIKGSPETVRAVLQSYDEDDLPVLFWIGIAYGGWINQNKDSIRAVADLPIAVAIMERVIEIDETFFFGGAHLFLGQYYGSRGKDLGGDPERAKGEFEKVLQLTGGKFLLAKVYMARYYAVPAQNLELYETLLDEVLEAPDDILPGEELTTAVAKHDADRLFLAADDFFLSE